MQPYYTESPQSLTALGAFSVVSRNLKKGYSTFCSLLTVATASAMRASICAISSSVSMLKWVCLFAFERQPWFRAQVLTNRSNKRSGMSMTALAARRAASSLTRRVNSDGS